MSHKKIQTEISSEKSSNKTDSPTDMCAVVKERRVEDQLRLRELELQTNFQIQTLSESLNLLKTDFHSWRDSLNEKIENVKTEAHKQSTKLTFILALLAAQFLGAEAFVGKLIGM